MIKRAGESVGIDLGTTYSSLAYMDQNMTPRIVQDSSGKAVVPSVIYFDDAGVVVGDLAVQQSKYDPDRVVQFVKVHMGDSWEQKYHDHVHTPESLSAIILQNLVRQAEPQIGPIRSAVITVPAYFSERRRRATQQAGEIAGLDVIGTLDEPMAATLAYGLHTQGEEQLVVVYDLGGGTFDVTVVRISPSETEELAIAGNRKLGGRDWDGRLMDHVIEQFERTHRTDPRSDLQAIQNLRLECELAKRRLSQMSKTAILFRACGRDHVVDVTRQQFEELTEGLLNMTKLTTEVALEDAGLDWPQISRVVLVGGSTHIPGVRRMLKEASGLEPESGVNPVLAVALGAAIYAYMLDSSGAPSSISETPLDEEARSVSGPPEQSPSGAGRAAATTGGESAGGESAGGESAGGESAGIEPKVQDARSGSPAEEIRGEPVETAGDDDTDMAVNVRFVTAHGVGIRAITPSGLRNVVLIPRNTPVPAKATKRFATASETGGDTYVEIEIIQGDNPDPELAEVLGCGKIEGFPHNEPSGQPVDVVMEFDHQARLHTSAVHINSGRQMQMSLEVPGGLRPEEIQQHREKLERTVYLSLGEG